MPPVPLRDSSFSLDVSGIGGFFGGEEAFTAMATVHAFKGRRWLGWYNSPGSYNVARRYGQLAKSRLWDVLYPGVDPDLASFMGFQEDPGPPYHGVYSGVIPQTGHLGYLLCRITEDLPVSVGKNTEDLMSVTALRFSQTPQHVVPVQVPTKHSAIAFIPIAFSSCACVVCALFHEWFSFSMILLGMCCNGIFCIVVGSADLILRHSMPSPNSPPGDGIFLDGNQIVIVKGPAGAVNCITKGWFEFRYKSGPEYNDIGIVSVVLTAQFLLQLFLVPQSHLFGQIMFLSTFAVSWIYNAYLASINHSGKPRQLILQNVLQPEVLGKVVLPNRTAMAAFVVFAMDTPHPRAILDALIPNDTPIWRRLKEKLCKSKTQNQFSWDIPDWKVDEWNSEDQDLLRLLLKSACAGYNAFVECERVHLRPPRKSEPPTSFSSSHC